MNILNKVTWQAMWKNRSRTIVTIIGIILSAAMFTAVTTLGVSLVNYLIDIAAYNDGDYFIRYDYGTDSDIEGIYKEESVSQVGDLKALGFTDFVLEQEYRTVNETYIVAAGDAQFYGMVSVRLEEGRLPENSDEIVITENLVSYLSGAGLPCGIGDTVTMTVVPEYVPEYYEVSVDLPTDGTAFTKEYQIVGISETFYKLDDFTLQLSYLLTFADENVEPALWHRIYVKTDPPKATYDLQGKPYGPVQSTNSSMLNLCGASKYANYNDFIYAICGVLIVIIMVGSISLIYNAFSISVSERTKQFGLLSSIGATKRQLRRSVYFEAMSLCLIGIPIGILCGYFGIVITLYFTADLVSGLLAGSTESGIDFHAVVSIPAFLCAAVVAAITVFLSVFIPAKRATRVAPIAAIRQTQDYQIPKKGLKSSKLTTKIWGLPGLMAQKYYAVSKHKYRSTVISLAISVVLFITSCGFTLVLQDVANSHVNTYNYDMYLSELSEVQTAEIRNHSAITKSVLCAEQQWCANISTDMLSEEYLEACSLYERTTGYEGGYVYVNTYYLEDSTLRAYLEDNHIDPEPYFDPKNPTALVMSSKIVVYPQNGNIANLMTYESDVFQESAESIRLYCRFIPESLSAYLRTFSQEYTTDTGTYLGYPMTIYHFALPMDESILDSNPYLQPDGSLRVVTVPGQKSDGRYFYGFYLYDPVSDSLGEDPIAVSEDYLIPPDIRIGATVDELPFGISTNTKSEVIALILPLSMANTEVNSPYLFLSINNYKAITAYFQEQELYYADLLSSEMQYRNMVTMINVFSYGFIILISLICICNVFNTISTNIALRRRDFGMLRSVGMQNKELNRMMIYECLRYGIQALVMGMPMGILGSFGIHTLTGSVGNSNYELPLIPMCISIVCVFVVVFMSMLYALSKLRKDNPIEAIRMENL